MKGGFQDNYYYQMVDNIRKYKGTRNIPVFNKDHSIKIDGNFKDWENVKSIFYDDKDDTMHRLHPGYGRIKEYINNTGRNDIVKAKVATEKDYISFYVETSKPIRGYGRPDWMNLFISIKDKDLPNWEGYQFLVNGKPKNRKTTSIEKNIGGWQWENEGNIPYRVTGNKLEIKIPKKLLDIKSEAFTIDYKWADNVPAKEGVMNFLDKGDAAPNARFNYRYIHSK